ncbi:hypothetical protein BGZ94_005874 [Podila epigama]|nr:hypothetical protein BGZ94_005874 [Podila epigama]
MSSFTHQIPLEQHFHIVRQLYVDASALEQSIQHHVEANRVGYRSTISSVPSSPASERSLSLPIGGQHQRRQNSVQSPQRRASRQNSTHSREDEDEQVPHFRSSHEELAFLRDSLKDVYEVILLEDLVAAVEQSVDERLWRHVFYTPIEELRAELRKLEKNPLRRQEVMDEISRLLDKGTGFYHEMITVLRCEHNIDIGTIAVDLLLSESGNSKGPSSVSLSLSQSQNKEKHQQQQKRAKSDRTRQPQRSKDDLGSQEYPKEALANCIQKCFVYLGDLARYRANIRLEAQTAAQLSGQDKQLASPPRHSASNWQASSRFYERAIIVFPDSGKPFGQMAILASYANDDLDALYWYNLRDLFATLSPGQDTSKNPVHDLDMDSDSDIAEDITKPASTLQDDALERCGLEVLFIKIQMDLFAPNLESSASFMAESSSKGDAMSLKQAQRIGLVYLLSMSAVLLEHQLTLWANQQTAKLRDRVRLYSSLMYPIELLIAFWISHWDQVWGMIRLEEKWAGISRRTNISLKASTVRFFRPFVRVLNTLRQHERTGMPSQEKISQNAFILLRRDQNQYFGLLPFRRFHIQFVLCMDVVENQRETQLYRFMLFASKVVQASEGIRGTVVELSVEPVVSDGEDSRRTYFRLLDAEDKRLLRERGSKMLASHWLQDQVSSLEKSVKSNVQSRSRPVRPRALVPLSSLPATVKLPPIHAFPSAPSEPGQTLLSEYYQRASGTNTVASNKGQPGRRNEKAAVGRPKPGSQRSIPEWTCLLDFSVLVWNLSDVKSLLDNRQCLLIVPLDVIDRLDVAKKGTDKENQKAREAIRFLDERLNRSRGHNEPLLVAQNVRDSLGRWSESIPFLVEESRGERLTNESKGSISDSAAGLGEQDDVEMTDSQRLEAEISEAADADVIMGEVEVEAGEVEVDEVEVEVEVDEATAKATAKAKVVAEAKVEEANAMDEDAVEMDKEQTEDEEGSGEMQGMYKEQGEEGGKQVVEGNEEEDDEDEANDGEEEEEEEEEEVRNAMNVPRVWRPILGACLFMLRKRPVEQLIREERFMLLTEDGDLTHYAGWFDIPVSTISAWKQQHCS